MSHILSIAEARKLYLDEIKTVILPDHIIAQINTKMVKCIGELKNETKDESYQEPSLDIFLVGEDTNQKYIDCIKYFTWQSPEREYKPFFIYKREILKKYRESLIC